MRYVYLNNFGLVFKYPIYEIVNFTRISKKPEKGIRFARMKIFINNNIHPKRQPDVCHFAFQFSYFNYETQ